MSKRNRKRSKPIPHNTQVQYSSSVSSTLLDIIIPVHRRIDLLEKCLEAIPEACNGISYKIYIWDNATPPEEKQLLYPKLTDRSIYTIMENKENVGFPLACNKAVARGRSPLIFLLNSDVILSPKSIEFIIKAMDDPQVGVAGMKLVFPDEAGEGLNPQHRPSGKLQHIGLMTNIRGDIVHAFVGWDIDHPKVNAMQDVLAVTGAALMTRRVIWNKVGGFNLQYGMGTYEDVDFCMSVLDQLNLKTRVVPEAVGIHYVGATAEKYKIPYPLQMNYFIFMQRWMNKLPYTEWRHW